MNWTSQNFATNDLARIQYPGSGGTRTLTSGSGTSITAGVYSVRLSDSGNGVASSVPLTIALASNTAINLQSTTRITVIQSKLMNIVPLDGNRTLGGGQNTVCDDRNLTVMWRGLGEAQFGVASISLNRQGGSGGSSTLGTALSNVPVNGNMSITFFCPRTATPSTVSGYAFQLSVQEPGGSAYTGTSASFNVATAPTPSPTPSVTPTASKTPSPTPSSTPTHSTTSSSTPSPSFSSTPTPSTSVSNTPTPSPTPTPAPSLDLAAIARSAAESVDTQTPALAGAFGGIGGILLLLGAWKWYENRKLTQKRMRKLAQTGRFMREAHLAYGIASGTHEDDPVQPSVVMYSVQGLPPKKQTGQETKQLESYKKAFPPKQTGSK